MKIEMTALEGVVVIVPSRFQDSRGFFSESWSLRTLSGAGFDLDFVQDNHSLSFQTGTVRGLHFQAPPHAQGKLVRCGRGRLLDVAVDIRVGSPTYGKWVAEELSAENGHQLLVPVGFLHGFVTLEPNTEVVYKCTDYYDAECDGSIRFDDPDIGINWPIESSEVVLSDKDRNAPLLRDFNSPFSYGG